MMDAGASAVGRRAPCASAAAPGLTKQVVESSPAHDSRPEVSQLGKGPRVL
jgi:hypothetical protein